MQNNPSVLLRKTPPFTQGRLRGRSYVVNYSAGKSKPLLYPKTLSVGSAATSPKGRGSGRRGADPYQLRMSLPPRGRCRGNEAEGVYGSKANTWYPSFVLFLLAGRASPPDHFSPDSFRWEAYWVNKAPTPTNALRAFIHCGSNGISSAPWAGYHQGGSLVYHHAKRAYPTPTILIKCGQGSRVQARGGLILLH